MIKQTIHHKVPLRVDQVNHDTRDAMIGNTMIVDGCIFDMALIKGYSLNRLYRASLVAETHSPSLYSMLRFEVETRLRILN